MGVSLFFRAALISVKELPSVTIGGQVRIGAKSFPNGSVVKNPPVIVGTADSIPGSGRSLGGGHDNPLQYSCLENPHGQRSLAGYNLSHYKMLCIGFETFLKRGEKRLLRGGYS